jgi:alkanesulfonate monooxygenase SsuD/methylene tetrahydromethanopterin reductase-like flavin-dependent oxidoreductase (luciferase family)
VFLNGGPKPHVAGLVADLRARAAPRPIRAFLGATLVIGRTAAEARDKLEDYRRSASVEAALVHASASLGIDLAALGLDDELPDGNAIQSNVTALRAAAPRATKRALVDRMILGSRQPPIVGSAEEVADALIAWVDEADVDGFNLSRTVMPECIEDVVELLVPVLQARGRYKQSYAPGTYREKLFGAGPRLAAPHPAAAVAR